MISAPQLIPSQKKRSSSNHSQETVCTGLDMVLDDQDASFQVQKPVLILQKFTEYPEMFFQAQIGAPVDADAFTQASTRTYLESPQKGDALFENAFSVSVSEGSHVRKEKKQVRFFGKPVQGKTTFECANWRASKKKDSKKKDSQKKCRQRVKNHGLYRIDRILTVRKEGEPTDLCGACLIYMRRQIKGNQRTNEEMLRCNQRRLRISQNKIKRRQNRNPSFICQSQSCLSKTVNPKRRTDIHKKANSTDASRCNSCYNRENGTSFRRPARSGQSNERKRQIKGEEKKLLKQVKANAQQQQTILMKMEKSGNLKNSAQSSRNPVFTLIKIIKDASHVKIEDFQNAE